MFCLNVAHGYGGSTTLIVHGPYRITVYPWIPPIDSTRITTKVVAGDRSSWSYLWTAVFGFVAVKVQETLRFGMAALLSFCCVGPMCVCQLWFFWMFFLFFGLGEVRWRKFQNHTLGPFFFFKRRVLCALFRRPVILSDCHRMIPLPFSVSVMGSRRSGNPKRPDIGKETPRRSHTHTQIQSILQNCGENLMV